MIAIDTDRRLFCEGSGSYGHGTYLLFLKMVDERSRPPYNQPSPVPARL
ncbi:MAG: hypothetical protein KGJ74_02390 [Betaproteobacteria bacterium]|nr:hypothetical protein [Betaproteobacteria bacterium]